MKGASAFQSTGILRASAILGSSLTFHYLLHGLTERKLMHCLLFIHSTYNDAAFLGTMWGFRSECMQQHCTTRKTAVFLLLIQVWLRLMLRQWKKKNPGEWLHWKPTDWSVYLENSIQNCPLVQSQIREEKRRRGGDRRWGRRPGRGELLVAADLYHTVETVSEETTASTKILKSSLSVPETPRTPARSPSPSSFKVNLPK